MQPRPAWLLAPLAGLLLGILAPDAAPTPVPAPHVFASGGAGPAATGEWGDRRRIQALLERAADFVTQATGRSRPALPGIRLTSAAELEGFLEQADTARLGVLFRDADAPLADLRRALARQLVTWYDARADAIHVLGENAARHAAEHGERAFLSERVLQLALLQELVVASDLAAHPALLQAWTTRATAEGVRAIEATLFGHAGVVATGAAQLREADEPHLRMLTQAPPGAPAPQAAAALALVRNHLRTVRVNGRTLFEGRGRTGQEEVLSDPPETFARSAEPEGPAREAGEEPIAPPPRPAEHAAIRELRVLALGEDWRTATEPLAPDRLRGLFRDQEEAEVEALAGAFRQGWSFTADDIAAGRSVRVRVLELADAAAAERYVKLARAASESEDESMKEGHVRIVGSDYAEGAGRDGGRPGFVVQKTLQTPKGEEGIVTQVVREKGWVLDLHFKNTPHTREQQDDVIESALEAVAASAGRRGR